jgi:hypothetical protein
MTSSKMPETVPSEGTTTSEALTTLSILYYNRTEVPISTPLPEESSTSSVTAGISSESSPILRSEETTLRSEGSTSAMPVSTDKALGTGAIPSEQPLTPRSTVTLPHYPVTVVTPITEEVPSENITIGEEITTLVSNESSREYSTTYFLTTSPSTPYMMATGTLMPTESTSTEFTSERYPSPTELPDCSVTPCHNGGTCIHTKEGPRVSVYLHSTETVTCSCYDKKLFQ